MGRLVVTPFHFERFRISPYRGAGNLHRMRVMLSLEDLRRGAGHGGDAVQPFSNAAIYLRATLAIIQRKQTGGAAEIEGHGARAQAIRLEIEDPTRDSVRYRGRPRAMGQ